MGPAASPAVTTVKQTVTAPAQTVSVTKTVAPVAQKQGGKVASTVLAFGPLDPLVVISSRSTELNIAEGLTGIRILEQPDGSFEVKTIPMLATSWTYSDDKRDVTWNLRQGVKWHNGADFTAGDVKASIDRALTHRAGSQFMPFLDEVEVIDDNTVKFKQSDPWVAMEVALATQLMVILPSSKTLGKPIDDDTWKNNLIGTGPFKLKERIAGETDILVKNNNYWRKSADNEQLPYLDELRFQVISDETIRTTALRSGQVDIAASLGSKSLPGMGGLSGIDISKAPTIITSMFYMNGGIKPFDDKRVRHAVRACIDKKEILESSPHFGAGAVSNNFVPAWSEYAWDNDPGYVPADPEKAKALLDEAGYPDGLPGDETMPYSKGDAIEWWVLPVAPIDDEAVVIQRQLARANIKVDIKTLDVPAWLDKVLFDKTYEMSSQRANYWGNPAPNFLRWFHSEGFIHYHNWGSDELDATIEEFARTIDFADAKKLSNKVQDLWYDASVWIPTVWTAYYAAHKDTVHGVGSTRSFNTGGTAYLDGVWTENK